MAVSDSKTRISKRAAFARLMISGVSVQEAAGAVGISERTGYRWAQDRNIMAPVLEADAVALAVLVRRLIIAGARAIGLLLDVLNDEAAPIGARVRAADIVLSRLLQLREIVTIEEAFNVLEQDIEQAEKQATREALR